MASITSGMTQVCLRQKLLQRRSKERALRRFEPFLLVPSRSSVVDAIFLPITADVPRLGAPVSPARISPRPLDFLRRRVVPWSVDDCNCSAVALKAGNGSVPVDEAIVGVKGGVFNVEEDGGCGWWQPRGGAELHSAVVVFVT